MSRDARLAVRLALRSGSGCPGVLKSGCTARHPLAGGGSFQASAVTKRGFPGRRAELR